MTEAYVWTTCPELLPNSEPSNVIWDYVITNKDIKYEVSTAQF